VLTNGVDYRIHRGGLRRFEEAIQPETLKLLSYISILNRLPAWSGAGIEIRAAGGLLSYEMEEKRAWSPVA
jgi:hypothetical protein